MMPACVWKVPPIDDRFPSIVYLQSCKRGTYAGETTHVLPVPVWP